MILEELRFLKEQNIRQENTITFLENKVGNHEERVLHLEKMQTYESNPAINPKNEDVTLSKNVREKRPARLLPMSLFRK